MDISISDLRAQLTRARSDFPFIDAAEQQHGLPAFLLYAVGSRESNLRNIAGDFSQRPGESSKRFHGFGVWQRDSGAFGVGMSYLDDVPKQAEDAGGLLASNFARFGRWDAATAAYNAGAGAVSKALQAGRSVDSVTTGKDYSTDVLARRTVLAGGALLAVDGGGTVHVVRPGETLSGIAQAFHTTVAHLVELNHMADADVIVVGQILRLPTPAPAHQVAVAPKKHVVESGENLSVIAAEFGTTVGRLVQLNHIANPDLIFVGQVLLVA